MLGVVHIRLSALKVGAAFVFPQQGTFCDFSLLEKVYNQMHGFDSVELKGFCPLRLVY